MSSHSSPSRHLTTSDVSIENVRQHARDQFSHWLKSGRDSRSKQPHVPADRDGQVGLQPPSLQTA
eukprot:1890150-Rhodomonas_salina.1